MARLDDRAYYEARLKAERRLAAASPDPAIAGVHLQLAEQYERLLGGNKIVARDEPKGESPALSIVTLPSAPAVN